MIPLLATVHPAFVLRMRRWDQVFRSDVGKALRHARGELRWSDPEMVLDPSVDELDRALTRLSGCPVATDTETDGLDPEKVNLRCVGLASTTFGVCAGFQSVEMPARIWRCPPDAARERIKNFFSLLGHPDGPSKLVLHNQTYDQRVFERHGMPLGDVGRIFDSILLHKLADSEMPHDLGFLSSVYLDCPRWKPDHDHDSWKSDIDLHRYCVLDCVATAQLWPQLAREVVATNQGVVYRGDQELQRLAIGMHRAGIYLDQAEQRRHSVRLDLLMSDAARRAEKVSVGPCPSVSSPDQVRDYLYTQRHIIASKGKEHQTPTGDASVDRDALHDLLRRQLDERDRAFIEAVLDYRRAQKAKSAFVDNLRPDEDGRIHATWNPHSVVSGRLSCSSVNLQTIPDKKQDTESLRSMFCAAPGTVLVGADYDQLHMRIIAVRAGVQAWLDVFSRQDAGEKGPRADLHTVNAAMFYAKQPEDVQKFERTCVKTLIYAACYGAGVATIQNQMARLRDPVTGARPFATLSHREASVLREQFMRAYPELPDWWETEVERWRSGVEIRSMIHGRLLRLRDLVDGDDEEGLSDIVNAPILLTEGDVAGGNGASKKAMQAIGWPWYGDGRGMGGSGLILHVHDSIVAEVGENSVEEAKSILRNSMYTTLQWEGRSVALTATPKAGRRWSDLS